MKAETIISLLIVPLVFIIYQLLKSKIDDSEKSFEKEMKLVREELLYLTKKQNTLLDTFLEKFSKWEDRLKDVLKDVKIGNFQGSFDKFIQYSGELKEEIGNEIDYLKKDIDRIDQKVVKIEKARPNQTSAIGKDDIRWLIEKKNQSEEALKLAKDQQALLRSCFEIMKIFDAKMKVIEKRITENRRLIKERKKP